MKKPNYILFMESFYFEEGIMGDLSGELRKWIKALRYAETPEQKKYVEEKIAQARNKIDEEQSKIIKAANEKIDSESAVNTKTNQRQIAEFENKQKRMSRENPIGSDNLTKAQRLARAAAKKVGA